MEKSIDFIKRYTEAAEGIKKICEIMLESKTFEEKRFNTISRICLAQIRNFEEQKKAEDTRLSR